MNRAFVLLRVSGGFKVNTLFVGVLVLFLSFVLLLFSAQKFSGKRILPKKGCHCLFVRFFGFYITFIENKHWGLRQNYSFGLGVIIM